MQLSRPVVNAVLFQFGWFACVLGGNVVAGAFLLPYLLVHFGWVSRLRGEWLYTIAVAVTGFGFDWLLSQAGVFKLAEPGFPVWLAALWVLFATLVPHGLRWLQGRYWLAAALGAAGGASSYAAGISLGVASADVPWLAYTVWAAEWALLMPLLVLAAERLLTLKPHLDTPLESPA